MQNGDDCGCGMTMWDDLWTNFRRNRRCIAAHQLPLGRDDDTGMSEIKPDGLESAYTPNIDCFTALRDANMDM